MNKLNKIAQEGKINQEASIRDSQSIIVHAPAQKLWDVLVDFDKWSEWNTDIKWAKLSGDLKTGNTFEWNIKGTTLKSEIQLVNEPETLVWTGKAMGIKAIHVWKLEAAEKDQTILTTEESMQGVSTLFYSHLKLHNTLLHWLSQLKQRAEE